MTRKRVLIVEDEAAIRSTVREALEWSGYETAEAADGSEGLAKAEGSRPDVILLDVVLPGLDGYEVCRRLKGNSMTAAIPVIFLTGLEHDALDQLANAVGATACLTKPFRIQALVAVIEGALANMEAQ